MKIGIFSDPHYSSSEITCSVRYNSKSLEKIKGLYTLFKEQGCDLVICLGDLTDSEETKEKEIENLREIGQVFDSFKIPTVCLMGNHDAFIFTPDEFYSYLGGYTPKDTSFGNAHLIFLDACYLKSGRHYAPGDTDWTDTYYPFVSELKNKLEGISGDAYIFMHQNLDSEIHESHRLHNADEIMEVLCSSGKVRAVYQGHYHKGNTAFHGGVFYKTLRAVCESEDGYYEIINI